MASTRRVILRVPEADYQDWKAQAKKHGISLSDFVRRRTNLRPVSPKTRKPKANAQETQESAQEHSRHCSPEEAAAYDAEWDADVAWAEAAIKASGRTAREWIDSLSPEERERVDEPLEDWLLFDERNRKDKAAREAQYAIQHELDAKRDAAYLRDTIGIIM